MMDQESTTQPVVMHALDNEATFMGILPTRLRSETNTGALDAAPKEG
jgi:hypothetical protein